MKGKAGSNILAFNYRMTISLCMICRDNEDTIETALKSAVGVFDEIIVVDTGSTDNTLSIVEKYTKKIARITWEDDFAKARNYGLDMATSDLIFWMDSDDELPENTQFAIRSIAKDNNPKAAYMFKIHNIFTDEMTKTWKNDYDHLKLFPNRKDIRFKNDAFGHMHESVEQDVCSLPIEIRSVDFSVIHHGYETPDLFERKLFRDIRIGTNKAGKYFQFRTGNFFFSYVYNTLSIWASISNDQQLTRVDIRYLDVVGSPFSELSEFDTMKIIEMSNEMCDDFKKAGENASMEILRMNNSIERLSQIVSQNFAREV
jgi:glycosyltransferase involved in cell wall biosynthesis